MTVTTISTSAFALASFVIFITNSSRITQSAGRGSYPSLNLLAKGSGMPNESYGAQYSRIAKSLEFTCCFAQNPRPSNHSPTRYITSFECGPTALSCHQHRHHYNGRVVITESTSSARQRYMCWRERSL